MKIQVVEEKPVVPPPPKFVLELDEREYAAILAALYVVEYQDVERDLPSVKGDSLLHAIHTACVTLSKAQQVGSVTSYLEGLFPK